MNGATGYGNKSLDDLLELVENRDYGTGEGLWLAKELRERFELFQGLAHAAMVWDKNEKAWVLKHD